MQKFITFAGLVLILSMQRSTMNTYIYAPKDDIKHRALWRQLYTSEEESKNPVFLVRFVFVLVENWFVCYHFNGWLGFVIAVIMEKLTR